MRMFAIRLLGGLVPLVVWLTTSGCGGSSPTAPPDTSIASAPPPVSVVEEPALREEPVPIAFVAPTLEPIHFEFNEARITPESEIALQSVAVVLKERPEWTVLLEGHCDERGTTEYNLALGESRAEAAKRYLVSLGIPEDRCATFSYGEERPADAGSGDESWARNRRAEFHLEGPEL